MLISAKRESPSVGIVRPGEICDTPRVKFLLPLLTGFVSMLLASCLVAPESSSGGLGATTVRDTNVDAINAAAQAVFAEYGYQPGPIVYPESISFDKPAGAFGELMYGGFDETTTFRVTLVTTQLPGTNDFRLSTRVSHVTDAGQAGFEDSTRMSGVWSAEFGPILKKIAAQAQGAGGI